MEQSNNSLIQLCDIQHDQWLRVFGTEHPQVPVYENIPVVFVTEMSDMLYQAMDQVFPPTRSAGTGANHPRSCNACRMQVKKLCTWRDANGNPLVLSKDKELYPECHWPLWEAVRHEKKITSVKVVSQKDFGLLEDARTHFSVQKPSEKIPAVNTEAYQKLVDKYTPLFMNTFSENGVKGIHQSLDVLIEALPKVTYGAKLLESAVWFRKNIPENFERLSSLQKHSIIVSAMFQLKFTKEVSNGDMSLPLYHQLTGNTLKALAVCDNVTNLQKLLQERLSPLNYQVKTAEAKDQQVENAIKYIGDFSAHLMTLESAYAHGAIKISDGAVNSATSAFESMRIKRVKTEKKSAAGFASRSKNYATSLRTMKDLMENMPDNLELYTEGQTPVYGVDFVGLKEDVYQMPFSWNFLNGTSTNYFSLSGWRKVIAILPMQKNYMFICEGASLPTNMTTMTCACHVSLLTAQYNKSCGAAFGKLGDNMKLITGVGPHAVGVGVSLNPKSLDDKNPPLACRTLKLRSEGQEFTIR